MTRFNPYSPRVEIWKSLGQTLESVVPVLGFEHSIGTYPRALKREIV